MADNKTNIITMSIINLIFFLVVSMTINFNNAVAQQKTNLYDFDVQESVLGGITDIGLGKLGEYKNDSISLTNETISGVQETTPFDKWEGVINILAGIYKLIGLILVSQFPLASFYSTFIGSAESTTGILIGTLFLVLWQIAILYNWIKFIAGSNRVNS